MELNHHHNHAIMEELLGFTWRDQYLDQQPIFSPSQIWSHDVPWSDLDFLVENQSLSHLPNTTIDPSCEGFSLPPPHQDLYHNPFTFTSIDHDHHHHHDLAFSHTFATTHHDHDHYLSAVPQVADNNSSLNTIDTPSFKIQEEPGFLFAEELEALFQASSACKPEPTHDQSLEAPLPPPEFHVGAATKPNSSARPKNKPEGHISKNLMAERRRRKRLNDRLSMLRSIVPKISKMDRTSILGDTIDYMKELLERINNLQPEIHDPNQLGMLMNTSNDGGRPNGVFLRNSPKFDVERIDEDDTRVEICCPGKSPELLLSTVATLEALGLEIQQCVISCFSDFAMQASCSQEMEQRGGGEVASCEDIKQALFRNAGYEGQCL